MAGATVASKNATYRQQALIEALSHLQSAIELLDQASAPGHIAAHVDLAVNELEHALANASGLNRLESDRERYGTN